MQSVYLLYLDNGNLKKNKNVLHNSCVFQATHLSVFFFLVIGKIVLIETRKPITWNQHHLKKCFSFGGLCLYDQYYTEKNL